MECEVQVLILCAVVQVMNKYSGQGGATGVMAAQGTAFLELKLMEEAAVKTYEQVLGYCLCAC